VNYSEQNPDEKPENNSPTPNTLEAFAQDKIEMLDKQTEAARLLSMDALTKGLEKDEETRELRSVAIDLLKKFHEKFPGKNLPENTKKEAEDLQKQIEDLDKRINALSSESKKDYGSAKQLARTAEQLRQRTQSLIEQVFPTDPSFN